MTQTLSEICTFQAAAVEGGVLAVPSESQNISAGKTTRQKPTELDAASE